MSSIASVATAWAGATPTRADGSPWVVSRSDRVKWVVVPLLIGAAVRLGVTGASGAASPTTDVSPSIAASLRRQADVLLPLMGDVDALLADARASVRTALATWPREVLPADPIDVIERLGSRIRPALLDGRAPDERELDAAVASVLELARDLGRLRFRRPVEYDLLGRLDEYNALWQERRDVYLAPGNRPSQIGLGSDRRPPLIRRSTSGAGYWAGLDRGVLERARNWFHRGRRRVADAAPWESFASTAELLGEVISRALHPMGLTDDGHRTTLRLVREGLENGLSAATRDGGSPHPGAYAGARGSSEPVPGTAGVLAAAVADQASTKWSPHRLTRVTGGAVATGTDGDTLAEGVARKLWMTFESAEIAGRILTVGELLTALITALDNVPKDLADRRRSGLTSALIVERDDARPAEAEAREPDPRVVLTATWLRGPGGPGPLDGGTIRALLDGDKKAAARYRIAAHDDIDDDDPWQHVLRVEELRTWAGDVMSGGISSRGMT